MNEVAKQLATEIIQRLQAEFPHLAMTTKPCPEGVDLWVAIPVQPGLDFEVDLILENEDELYLHTVGFTASWFPINRPVVVEKCHAAIAGWLAGRNRIVTFVRWGRTVGADLQRPHDGGWKTIFWSRRGLLPMGWFSQRRMTMNRAATGEALRREA